MYYETPMTDRRDKPYTTYRAGDDVPSGASGRGGPMSDGVAPGGGARSGGGPRHDRPPRDRRGLERRRRRRSPALLLLIVLLLIVAAVSGVAAATGWGPFGGGDGTGGSGTATGDATIPAAPNASASSPAVDASSGPSARPTPSTAPSFSVTAGGDTMSGFGVSDVVGSSGSALFKSVAPTFEKSDFGFVNLESPLTTGGEPQGWKDVVIKGNPALAPAMADSGINVVTLANNHAGDMGDSGLLDTLVYCKDAGITVVGAGKDLERAMSGAVLTTTDGTKVAFLGFSDVLPVGYPATSTSPGTAPGRADLGAVTAAIRAAKKKADYVVVGWHWNFEYKRAPSSLELSEGHAAIDAGADIVFAHHPHLLDGVEEYHDGLIFYSLGNLVFGGFSGETAETVLVRAKVSEEGIDAQVVPVVGGGTGVPTVVKGSQAESILQRFSDLSGALDTNVKIAGARGYVHVKR
jgi:poly-gamma-glutamate synthesis protein (capsule biosynthesis protein)